MSKEPDLESCVWEQIGALQGPCLCCHHALDDKRSSKVSTVERTPWAGGIPTVSVKEH